MVQVVSIDMAEKMERQKVRVGTLRSLDKEDREYWRNATVQEKLETITYLRECFYGPEATTGRLQRIHTVFKQS